MKSSDKKPQTEVRDSYHSAKIDREKTCPFLVRVFYKQNSAHSLSQFDQSSVPPATEEQQIFTWMDATLREISEHIQREIDISRKRDTQLEFSLVYQDFGGSFRRKYLGVVNVGKMGGDDLKSLYQLRYQIGDYITLAINEPKAEKKPDTTDKKQEDAKDQYSRHDQTNKRHETMKRDRQRVDYDSRRIRRSRSRSHRQYGGQDRKRK